MMRKDALINGKKRIRFGVCYLVIVFVIIMTIINILNKISSADYSTISLQNIDASIPSNFLENDKSIQNINDYMFYIGTENNEYILNGIQLTDHADEDVEKILNKDTLSALKTANTGERVLEAIQTGTGLFLNNYTQGCISKPSYTKYYFCSDEEIEGKKYQAYVLFLIQGDTRYIQINLFDEDHVITEKQMKHMRLLTSAIRK